MSSLCFAETRTPHTAESSISSLSSVSTSLSSSTTPRPTSEAQTPLSPSQASHYRRITSDLVKRRAANGRTGAACSSTRRRRGDSAQASISSIASTSLHRVPELVGGHPYVMPSHSRTASEESGASSRWPSLASGRGIVLAEVGQAGLGNVKEEKEVDVERLADAEEDIAVSIIPHDPIVYPARRGSLSFATLNNALSHPETAFGMGQDMQDVLDEIIMMEQGFNIQSSESENEDVAQDGRPHTPLGRGSVDLPAAPRRSAHYLDESSYAASMPFRSQTSRHNPSRSEPSIEKYAPECIMSQLPSAFEDAEEDSTATEAFPSLAEGRRSFSRRSRSEIRRSLSFIPPRGYRASLLANLQDPAPRVVGAHPYRRSMARPATVDDSVTRFQFPKMAMGRESGVPRTIDEVQEMEVVTTPTEGETNAGGLAPALFPASPVKDDTADEGPAGPTSGLRLGVLLGSGVDEEEVAWFRSRRTGEEGAMDMETP